METTNKVELKIIPEGSELILRHGEALELLQPEQVSLEGTITAPGDWAEHRAGTYDATKAFVFADYAERTLALDLDEKDALGTVIIGALKLHPELAALRINAPQMYTHETLYKLLKFKGSYFKSRDKHLEMLSKLKAFEATVHKEFASANDYKGAEATKKITDIKTNLDLIFSLTIPIFTGQERHEFDVDICVDAKGQTVEFWLESVALHELITTETERIFDQELGRLKQFAIVRTY